MVSGAANNLLSLATIEFAHGNKGVTQKGSEFHAENYSNYAPDDKIEMFLGITKMRMLNLPN